MGKDEVHLNSYLTSNIKDYPMKQELLDILACPKCKGPVQLNQKKNGLICRSCKLIYAIRDDIPIMLIDEAKPLDSDSHN